MDCDDAIDNSLIAFEIADHVEDCISVGARLDNACIFFVPDEVKKRRNYANQETRRSRA
jgi:hypothetical protein